MSNDVISIGNQVRVTSYGPFRGLKGTIQAVDRIVDGLDDPFCFYLVALVGAAITEPVWFEYHEVEFIGLPAVALQPQTELTSTVPMQWRA
jgi:hypothetical protein